jgi:hypothetical protein
VVFTVRSSVLSRTYSSAIIYSLSLLPIKVTKRLKQGVLPGQNAKKNPLTYQVGWVSAIPCAGTQFDFAAIPVTLIGKIITV